MVLTLWLPWVNETEFLLTISNEYNVKQAIDENIEKYQLGDYKLIQY